jgi:hypothetical protein
MRAKPFYNSINFNVTLADFMYFQNLPVVTSDAFIGSKLKQIAFVLVSKSKKQIGLICFSFGLKTNKSDLICFSFEFKKTN